MQTRERLGLLDPEGACRLVGGDADGLPGLVVETDVDGLIVLDPAPDVPLHVRLRHEAWRAPREPVQPPAPGGTAEAEVRLSER